MFVVHMGRDILDQDRQVQEVSTPHISCPGSYSARNKAGGDPGDQASVSLASSSLQPASNTDSLGILEEASTLNS